MSEQNIDTLITGIAWPVSIILLFLGIFFAMYLGYKLFEQPDEDLIKLRAKYNELEESFKKYRLRNYASNDDLRKLQEQNETLRHSIKNQTAKLHYYKKKYTESK